MPPKNSEEEEAKQKELEKIQWLAQEEKLRAETRRLTLEESKLEKQMEERKKKQMEHIQKLEEARILQLNNTTITRKKGKGTKE